MATASNLDTLLGRGTAESAHAVEFSKTVAPLPRGGFPPQRRVREPNRIPERTDEYSAEADQLERPDLRGFAGPEKRRAAG